MESQYVTSYLCLIEMKEQYQGHSVVEGSYPVKKRARIIDKYLQGIEICPFTDLNMSILCFKCGVISNSFKNRTKKNIHSFIHLFIHSFIHSFVHWHSAWCATQQASVWLIALQLYQLCPNIVYNQRPMCCRPIFNKCPNFETSICNWLFAAKSWPNLCILKVSQA